MQKKTATAKATEARVSTKHSVVICKAIRSKKLEKAKSLLENMSIGKADLDGKYYTKASKKILELLKSAEANAVQKGMESSKLFISIARPSKGSTFMRPRTRGKLRGHSIKSTNIEIVLEER